MAAILFVVAVMVAYRLTMPGVPFLLQYMDNVPGGLSGQREYEILDRYVQRGTVLIPARIYKPKGGWVKTALLVHGVHYKGYEEPRLVHFAKTLAGLGVAVVVPDIHELKSYELTPRAVDVIEQTALWILEDTKLVEEGEKIGIMGISFSGGLVLSAGSRASLRESLSFIFSFGGHGDLDETLDYMLTGAMPDGRNLPAHIYGQAVIARLFADRLVPPGQVAGLRAILFDYLRGALERVNAKLSEAKEQTRKIVTLCLERDDETLGKVLRERLGTFEMHPLLSPVKGPVPDCPIFLLHGSKDNVIPPSETNRLARWAAPRTEVTVLVTDLIQHVELGENAHLSPLSDYWALVRFWTELLRS